MIFSILKITIILGRNPRKGGSPPKETIKIIRIKENCIVIGFFICLIKEIFPFFKINKIGRERIMYIDR